MVSVEKYYVTTLSPQRVLPAIGARWGLKENRGRLNVRKPKARRVLDSTPKRRKTARHELLWRGDTVSRDHFDMWQWLVSAIGP